MKLQSRYSLLIAFATILAVTLACSWSIRPVKASRQPIRYQEAFQELFEPTSDAWSNEEFMVEMAAHPSFDAHLESVLGDLQQFDFDIEADDAIIEYMSTLSDSHARAEWRRWRRAFRRVGRAFSRVARGVVKVVKKYGAVIAPIALTIATGGVAAPSLAGSLGGTLAKGAAMLAKVSSIASKANMVIGGLNAVTGGKSKFLNKLSNFSNKVTNVLGKGGMILNAGGSIAKGLSGLSNLSVKGIAAQLKPENLFKGNTLLEKGTSFLNKASGFIKKGQEIASSLNNVTGGKIKALDKISKGLDKAQKIAGIGSSALTGLDKGLDSLKNLKNIKDMDMSKLLTAENIKKGLGKLDNTIGKTKDILSNVNEVTGGKNKNLNKIINALDKAKKVASVGSNAVDRIEGIKNSIADLKNVDSSKIKDLFTSAGIQKALGKLDNSLGKGKDLLQQVNEINGGKSKTLNKIIQKLEKGQQAVSIGSTVAKRYDGIKSSIENLSNMKAADLENLLNFKNVQTGLGKAKNAMSNAQDLVSKLNDFTNGRSKTLVSLVEKLKKGQQVTSVTSKILDGASGIKGSLENLKNLKREDLVKILDAEQLQGVLNRAAKAFSKGENIVSELNEITNGKNKNLGKLLQSLRRGQMIAKTASSGVGTYTSAKNSMEEMKKLEGKNLEEILKSDALQEVFDSWKGTVEQGKEFVSQAKELKEEFKKKQESPIEDEQPVDASAQEPQANEQPVDGPQGEPDQSSSAEEPVDSEEPIDPATAMG